MRRVIVEIGRWVRHSTHGVTGQSELLVHLSLLQPLVFCSAVLEPDLDLCFCEIKAGSQLETARASDVLVLVEFQLQFQCLLAGECRSLSTRFVFFSLSSLCSCVMDAGVTDKRRMKKGEGEGRGEWDSKR